MAEIVRVSLSVTVWAEDDESCDQVIRQIAGAVYGPSRVRVVERDRGVEDE